MGTRTVDKGWAWAVVLGTGVTTFWAMGSFTVYGVIFVEVADLYQATSALSSVMFSIFSVSCAISVIMQAAITGRISERTQCFVAGIVLSLAFIVQFWSPNIYFFVITFGILVGTGSCIAMLSSLVILGKYFDKKLSIASGLSLAGASCGQLIIPQILRVLLQSYGLRGAMLVLGACHLHVTAAALLFRPISLYDPVGKPSATKIRPKKDVSLGTGANEPNTSGTLSDGRPTAPGPMEPESPASPTSEHNPTTGEIIRHLCASPRFHLFLAGRCLTVTGFNLLTLFMPSVATSRGFNRSDVAILLTVMGAVDLPSRPLHGWITSFKRVDATYYIGITTLLGSVAIFICNWLPSKLTIFIFGVSMIFLFNPNICLINVITVSAVGRRYFPQAVMFGMLSVYVMMSFLPTVFGWLYDVVGSTSIIVVICTVLSLVGGLLTVTEKLLRPR